jgi:hypothetical protein
MVERQPLLPPYDGERHRDGQRLQEISTDEFVTGIVDSRSSLPYAGKQLAGIS